MVAALLELEAQMRGQMIGLFAVFLRVGAAMALMPGFGEQAVPMRVRLGLAVAFSLVVWPLVPGLPADALPARYFFSETIAGLSLGLFFRLFVIVLQLAGSIAAQATSLSQIFGGSATPDPMPAFGNLLVVGGLALAMQAGLHVKLALALVDSYRAVPPGTLPSGADLAEWGTAGISRAFATAFSLSAPFLIVSVLYNLALGAINRAMPQLLVAFVGAPAITLGGLMLIALAAPFLLVLWLGRLDAGLSDPFGGAW
ncbi:MAG: flagellar biosynthetic protein FliR [Rhodobacteraceae bacterium]|nr:flagellar biosynthetic protein FliR [Paracoccaceae bacterium]